MPGQCLSVTCNGFSVSYSRSQTWKLAECRRVETLAIRTWQGDAPIGGSVGLGPGGSIRHWRHLWPDNAQRPQCRPSGVQPPLSIKRWPRHRKSRRRFLGYPASSSGCTRDAVEATADDLPASFAHMWAGPLHLRNANVSSGSSGSISAGSTRQRRLPRRLQHACGATGRIRGHGDRWCRVAPSCMHRE